MSLSTERLAEIRALQDALMHDTPKVFLLALAEKDLLAAVDALNHAGGIEADVDRADRYRHVAGTLSDVWQRSL